MNDLSNNFVISSIILQAADIKHEVSWSMCVDM